MSSSSAEIQAKIDKLEVNMGRLDQITNGSDTTDVTIDTGTVPSIAKFFKIIGDEAGGYVTLAQAAATQAEDVYDNILNYVSNNLEIVINTVGNGTTTVFTLLNPLPASNGHLYCDIYVGNSHQKKDGLTYTITGTGTTITFSSAPANGVEIYGEGIAYTVGGASSLGSDDIANESAAPGATVSDAIDSKAGTDSPTFTDKIDINGVTGSEKSIEFLTATLKRWKMYSDSSAEGGSNSGSNFILSSYANDGNYIGDVFNVNRNTRKLDFKTVPSYNGTNLATLDDVGGANTFFNPSNYGMVADGVTDNSAAFQAMMYAMPAAGGVVIFEAGEYYFANSIYINRPVAFIGANSPASSTGTTFSFAAAAMLRFESFAGGHYSGISFYKKVAGTRLLSFPETVEASVTFTTKALMDADLGHVAGTIARVTSDGTSTNNGLYRKLNVSGSGSWRKVSGVSYVNFSSCNFSGEATSALIYMTNVLKIGFTQCRFVNSYTGGGTRVLWLDGSLYGVSGNVRSADNVDNIEFLQCLIAGTNGGDQTLMQLDGKADSTKFTQCALVFGANGLRLTNTGTTVETPNFTYFSDGGFENGSGNAVRLEYGDRVFFSNFYASHNGTGSSTDVIYTDTTFDGNVNFNGGYVRAGRRNGYRFDGGQVSVIGGSSGNNGTVTSGSSGIYISTTAAMCRIVGVKCGPYPNGSSAGQAYGINNNNGGSQSIIIGNDLTGNVTAGITGTTTGTAIGLNLT
jgi:hypothetical protein